MKFSEAKIKKVFILRLHDREKLPDVIEEFALKHKIRCALCFMLGGTGGGRLVVGPEKDNVSPINPILQTISGTSEILGIGTIFPDENKKPKLHMHAATGRKKNTLVGCIRPGINVWKIVEFIIIEITGTKSRRKLDSDAGFSVLEPE